MEAQAMAAMEKKSFDSPEETRSIDKGSVEILNLGGKQVMRATFQPGWKWSECVRPVAGTDTCQVSHLVYTVSGRMKIKMDDGTEDEVGPGDVVSIPPGHDAWIVGDEPYVGVDFQGAASYAKPQG
jgi:mannose-6-phosphate isomerase-like protein (cupin superfamily)